MMQLPDIRQSSEKYLKEAVTTSAAADEGRQGADMKKTTMSRTRLESSSQAFGVKSRIQSKTRLS